MIVNLDQQETLHYRHRRSDSSSSQYGDDDEPRSLEQPSVSPPPTSHFDAPGSAAGTTLSSAPTSFERVPVTGCVVRQKHHRKASAPTSIEGYGGRREVTHGEQQQQQQQRSRSEEEHATTPEDDHANLGSWAPEGQLPVFGRQPEPQLPDFLGSVDASTSNRLGPGQVQKEMEESINNLLSEKVSPAVLRVGESLRSRSISNKR